MGVSEVSSMAGGVGGHNIGRNDWNNCWDGCLLSGLSSYGVNGGDIQWQVRVGGVRNGVVGLG